MSRNLDKFLAHIMFTQHQVQPGVLAHLHVRKHLCVLPNVIWLKITRNPQRTSARHKSL